MWFFVFVFWVALVVGIFWAYARRRKKADSLRAREIGAEIIMKATKVDGIYDSDPAKNPNAKKFESLTYLDVIQKKLDVMDATAVTMCMEAGLPILVFKMGEPGCVQRAVTGVKMGTFVR
ncbi:MAG: hypothetical protein EBU49_09755 [Proteobacteria bacterium]|nr:hypothetical protein [Pseudomonadota bacterium]